VYRLTISQVVEKVIEIPKIEIVEEVIVFHEPRVVGVNAGKAAPPRRVHLCRCHGRCHVARFTHHRHEGRHHGDDRQPDTEPPDEPPCDATSPITRPLERHYCESAREKVRER